MHLRGGFIDPSDFQNLTSDLLAIITFSTVHYIYLQSFQAFMLLSVYAP